LKRQSDTKPSTSRQAGTKIPDQPRDCGPHVDTWPILDTPAGDTPKPKSDGHGTPKRDA
jgi:hypothetical protein